MEIDFFFDLFAPFGVVSTRKMFGVDGIYCDGLFFAIVADGELWLKVDATTCAEFEKVGAEPYMFVMKGKPSPTPYYRAPEGIYDDEDSLRHWTKLALGAAARKKNTAAHIVTERKRR